MLLGKRSGKHLIFRMDKDEIRLAVLNLSSSDPVPECSTVIETPEGAIEDGDLKRPDLLEEALKAVLSQPEYKKIKKAIFTICTGQVISETVTIPAVSEKKLEKMLQANLDMYFPVSTAEHHLVYHILDKLEGEEGKEMLVQLWAIPRDMIVSYYALAKLLGVAVTAIDYCGNSLVSSVGATFAVPEERDAKGKKPKKEKKPSRFGKKKKAEQDETYQPGLTSEEPVEEQEAVPTEVYLSLEEEHIIATFVQKNQVKMQRVFLTGYSVAAELDEVRLTLDYFTSLEGADPEKMTAVLCGKLASDPLIVGDVESALDLPVSVWNCPGGPEWTLNVGAAKSRKDFGIADVAKSMKGANPLQERWQIYALLASAVLLISSVALTVFSNLGWNLDLSSLDQRMHELMIQEVAHSGNAERYYEYESKYDAYSYDWDVMFSSLRTYNDNLVKMLEEVERTIPKDAAVVTIGIADEGLGLQFACEDKEMAAYLIMSLRDLKYATLSDISNLSVGPGATAQDMLPSLSQRNQMTGAQGGFMQGFQDGFNETFDGEEGAPGTGEAAPKTGASNMSISELMALAESMGIDIDSLTMQEKLQLYQMYQNGELDQYLGGSGSTTTKQDPILVAGAAIKTGKITKDDVEEAIEDLTVHQKDILEGAYGATPKPKHDMAYMRKHYKSLKPRQEAIDTMLTTDEFAAYRFHLAFMEDLSREEGKTKLYDTIADDLWENGDVFSNLMSGNMDQMNETMPELVDILTKNDKTVTATENLIATDDRLANRYAYYWCVEEGVQKANSNAGEIDVDELMDDMVSGKLANNSDELRDVVEALAKLLLVSDPALKEEWEDMNGGDSIGDILGGLDQEEPVVEDTRIHFAVALSYKPELIEAEQYHKGLPYYAKLDKVEVE